RFPVRDTLSNFHTNGEAVLSKVVAAIEARKQKEAN
ncbi:PTS fructose transporter subunit IIB, partial [Vibrio parahaemolyticus]|nr:PTS fructose transporter subunit IIB [Vibrio parahaemolyticus]